MKEITKDNKWIYLVIIVFTLLTHRTFRDWYPVEHPFIHDVDQYYSYCVMAFVKNDLSFKNELAVERGYWLVETDKGKVQRFTMGMAIMYSPFFLMGHFFSQVFEFKYDGYTSVYAFFISLGTFFYVFIGFYFLRLALKMFYDEKVVAITILGIFMCTNLFYYTVGNGEMSHSYLFSLLSIYVYCTILWYERYQSRYLYLVSFILGFVTLIRPIEIINGLFFIIYGLFKNKNALINIFRNIKLLLISCILFVIPMLMQVIYWRVYGGKWVIYTYGEEGFFWLAPKIWDVLFSYRNGAVVYSPILFLSFMGFIPLYKTNKGLFYSSLITFLTGLYVISTWWTWWYGGGFGNRALIEFYVYLSFPLSTIITYILIKLKFKIQILNIIKNILFTLLMLSFVTNNLIRHYQKIVSIVHWDSMSKEAFWHGVWKINMNAEERAYRESLYVYPDYSAALKGRRSADEHLHSK